MKKQIVSFLVVCIVQIGAFVYAEENKELVTDKKGNPLTGHPCTRSESWEFGENESHLGRYFFSPSCFTNNDWKSPISSFSETNPTILSDVEKKVYLGKLSTSTIFDYNSKNYVKVHKFSHAAVDVESPYNAQVYAIAPGIIKKVYWDESKTRDNFNKSHILIEHNYFQDDGKVSSFCAIYGHVFSKHDDKPEETIKKYKYPLKESEQGAIVQKGEEVGNIRRYGTPSHLHFGINKKKCLDIEYTISNGRWGVVKPTENLSDFGFENSFNWLANHKPSLVGLQDGKWIPEKTPVFISAFNSHEELRGISWKWIKPIQEKNGAWMQIFHYDLDQEVAEVALALNKAETQAYLIMGIFWEWYKKHSGSHLLGAPKNDRYIPEITAACPDCNKELLGCRTTKITHEKLLFSDNTYNVDVRQDFEKGTLLRVVDGKGKKKIFLFQKGSDKVEVYNPDTFNLEEQGLRKAFEATTTTSPWYCKAIIWLQNEGIKGIINDINNPDRKVPKAEFLDIMLRANDSLPEREEQSSLDKEYPDVKNHDPYSDIVHLATRKEIVSGEADGTFKPQEPINRATAATIIAKAISLGGNLDDPCPKIYVYEDVKPEDWYCGFINGLKGKGIMKGLPDGNFGVKKYVTFAETAMTACRVYAYRKKIDMAALCEYP